jgi:hypothetical protein
MRIVLDIQWQHCSYRRSSVATVLPLNIQYNLDSWMYNVAHSISNLSFEDNSTVEEVPIKVL